MGVWFLCEKRGFEHHSSERVQGSWVYPSPETFDLALTSKRSSLIMSRTLLMMLNFCNKGIICRSRDNRVVVMRVRGLRRVVVRHNGNIRETRACIRHSSWSCSRDWDWWGLRLKSSTILGLSMFLGKLKLFLAVFSLIKPDIIKRRGRIHNGTIVSTFNVGAHLARSVGDVQEMLI
jgi:hypothetical protein